MSAEIVTNRKALRDYHILETLEAGIELKGTEVKSIRSGLVNLQGSFARLEGERSFFMTATSSLTCAPATNNMSQGAVEGCSCTGSRSTS